MAITTYTELKTAIGAWTDRSDLTSYYDDFIQQTESFFKLPPIRPTEQGIGGIRANITRATGTLSTSASTLARPSDFLEAYRLDLTGTTGVLLDYVNAETLAASKREGSGRPRYWTVSDVIELDVTPDSAYAYELSYYPDYAGLDGSTADNWVLLNHPNLYLSGCLFNAYTFLLDDKRADRWLAQYKSLCHGVNRAYARSRVSQGPIAAKVG
jgi:hypothetical protein